MQRCVFLGMRLFQRFAQLDDGFPHLSCFPFRLQPGLAHKIVAMLLRTLQFCPQFHHRALQFAHLDGCFFQ